MNVNGNDLRVLAHLYVRPDLKSLHRAEDGAFPSRWLTDAALRLRYAGLVDRGDFLAPQLTEKGRVYVEALLETPLPVQTWKVPRA